MDKKIKTELVSIWGELKFYLDSKPDIITAWNECESPSLQYELAYRLGVGMKNLMHANLLIVHRVLMSTDYVLGDTKKVFDKASEYVDGGFNDSMLLDDLRYNEIQRLWQDIRNSELLNPKVNGNVSKMVFAALAPLLNKDYLFVHPTAVVEFAINSCSDYNAIQEFKFLIANVIREQLREPFKKTLSELPIRFFYL
jgi:hypothetical protein